ncbi:MAG: ClpXP protease specificity-enhancing factor SspB [Holosporales bacterium]|jgi:hypothetical protein|nr:ClpXP protease specificity-enhancing factor SspB [Holosporales bacterium]
MSRKLDYGFLLKKASLSVVKEVLKQISKDGLFKKQHIYVTFSLNHPGTRVSQFLREEFEDEMTVVLQYEFWDLRVDDYGFSVSLAFQHSDETLYIPFSSIILVSDPSEDFSLEFTPDCSDIKHEKHENTNQQSSSKKVISLDIFRKET